MDYSFGLVFNIDKVSFICSRIDLINNRIDILDLHVIMNDNSVWTGFCSQEMKNANDYSLSFRKH